MRVQQSGSTAIDMALCGGFISLSDSGWRSSGTCERCRAGSGRYRKSVASANAKNPVDPFIDPEGYRAYLDAAETELR